jgi:hypothetical protein
MHISIDNDTDATQLYHLSILFQSLAKAYGFEVPKTNTSVGELTVELNIDTTDATAAIDKLAAHAAAKGVDVVEVPPVTYSVETVPVNTDHASIDDAGTVSVHVTPPVTTDTNLDSSGLPWDARIHAGSRERNTDGSWRVRRKPKTVEQDEWDATLARVIAELTDLMAIPVSPGAVADAAAEEALTDDEVDEFVNIIGGVVEPTVIESVGSYTEVEGSVPPPTATVGDAVAALNAVAPPVTIAPPVVVPPVTAVAPPIKPAIETFPQVMVWLTAHTPKDEASKPVMVAKVNQILTDNGLTVLQQLNQRPDLIPQIMSQFVEAFGE